MLMLNLLCIIDVSLPIPGHHRPSLSHIGVLRAETLTAAQTLTSVVRLAENSSSASTDVNGLLSAITLCPTPK